MIPMRLAEGEASAPSGALSGAARVPAVSKPGGEADKGAQGSQEGPRPASHWRVRRAACGARGWRLTLKERLGRGAEPPSE